MALFSVVFSNLFLMLFYVCVDILFSSRTLSLLKLNKIYKVSSEENMKKFFDEILLDDL